MTRASKHPHPDEPGFRHPPMQPMPPAPDLQFVVPPTDPLGLPQQPVPTSGPMHHDAKRPSLAARWLAFGIAVLLIVGVALLFWFGS